MIDITPIFEGIITVLVAVVTTILIPYIKSKIRIYNQQADDLAQANVDYWVKMAVAAVEQIATQANQNLKGQAKKQYVINWLNEHNIDVDEAKLDAQIEAAVYQLKNGIIVNSVSSTTKTTEG